MVVPQHSTILRSAHRVYFLRAVYGSHNKQLLFSPHCIRRLVLRQRRRVFTARYGLNLVILDSKISTANTYIVTWIKLSCIYISYCSREICENV